MTLAVNIAQSGSNNQTFRNRIINGAMVFDQRNNGAAVTVNSGTDVFPVDRFACSGQSADGVFTAQQSSTAPAGFSRSVVCTVTTADSSIGATQRYFIEQKVEGFNTVDLNWGTANAQPVTLSFWVRSSLTGTFGGSLSGAGGGQYYPFSYTISAANTWEYKTVTVPGPTSGSWDVTNGVGIEVIFSLGAGSSRKGTANVWTNSVFLAPTGSVDLISTNGATFFLTGVQLEEGTAASPFEFRQYGTELALCQRYLEVCDGSGIIGGGRAGSPARVVANWNFSQQKRATPTITFTGASMRFIIPNVAFVGTNGLEGANPTQFGTKVELIVSSGGSSVTNGICLPGDFDAATLPLGRLLASAEL